MNQKRRLKGGDFDSESQKLAYFLGYQVAGQFKNSPIPIDQTLLFQGFSDALEGEINALSDTEQQAALAVISLITR